MNRPNRVNSVQPRWGFDIGSQPTFSFSQGLYNPLSQDMNDTTRIFDSLVRAGQTASQNSSNPYFMGELKSNQQNQSSFQSQELSGSQQTVMLSQNNSQEDISRSDSNYQGLVHVINQSQSQSATLLYPMYQSQGAISELTLERAKTKSIDKAYSRYPEKSKASTSKSKPIRLTPIKQQIVRLPNITIKKVKKKHKKKGSPLFQI